METIYFGHDTLKWSILSNFHPSEMLIDGKVYHHVEGYYQSQKFAGIDSEIEDEIRSIEDPKLCRRIARQHKMPYDREKEWTSGLRDRVMRRAVLCKFLSNSFLLRELMSTGQNMLIEDNRFDEYWACGRLGRGMNKLGEMLMELRVLLENVALN